MTTSSTSWYWKLCSTSSLALGVALACWGDCALAQIVPDSTLGLENSTVTSIGPKVDYINGGATRGANLFHSFQEFNVGSGESALFTNPPGIENILSRVTGANASNIEGTLGVIGGNANLFLINPNGINFGTHARLSLNGSFVGTTANAIRFNSGNIFSANPAAPLPTGLLNVKPDALLFNQIAASAIVNRSIASSRGLQVPQGKSLLLVGGDVRLEGGRLLAPGGRVELGGLASPGSVGLSINGSEGRLSFPDGVARADVYLTNSGSNPARVNVEDSNSGSIAITARNIEILGGSSLINRRTRGLGFPTAQVGDVSLSAQRAINIANGSIINIVGNQAKGNGGNINITTGSLSVSDGAQLITSTLGEGNAGNVTINARDTVSFDGVASNGSESGVFSQVLSRQAKGNGGNIDITTGSLFVTNGAKLNATTWGEKDAGSVTINARDTVSFDGMASNESESGAFSRVERAAKGNGGDINITITAGSLFVTNGAKLSASTFGQGHAGNVIIDVRDMVSFTGVARNGRAGGAFSAVSPTGVGKGGSLKITTRSLAVTNGALLTASSLGQGDGGNITLNANTLEAVNGGQIRTTSYRSGKAGNITLNVTDSVTVAGSDPTYWTRLAQFGESRVDDVGPVSGLFATTTENSTGHGGDLRITTGQLIVGDTAEVTVSSEGIGNAGNLEIASRDLLLDNRGVLRATTRSGEGGNITVRSQDLLRMRHNSEISTKAGGTGNGGNIDIETDFIVAVPREDSDITANADQGNGGKVKITAAGIFGTQFRESETPESSDITASSELGVDGVVEINTLDVDLNRGLVTLPVELVDTSALIAQGCSAGGGSVGRGESKFIITGRSGLPPTPRETLSSDTVLEDWGTLAVASAQMQRLSQRDRSENRFDGSTVSTVVTRPTPAPLVEAQGWVIGANGEVVLTATAPTVTPYIPWLTPSECQAS